MAKFNHLDIRGTKKVPAAFGNVFICSGSATDAKTVVFPDGYLNGATPEPNLAFKAVFPNGHNAANASSYLSLNGVVVVSNQNGTLAPLPIHEMTEGGSTVYKVLNANTALELYYTEDYDGNSHPAFVVVGNPLVLSSSAYSIYADGQIADQTPVGVITAYYGTSDPFGWLICDGRTNLDLQHKYPKLYAFLGNSNGLPDLRECTLKGIGQTSYATHGHLSGLTIGGFVNDRVIQHTHLVDLPLNFAGSGSKIYYLTNAGAGTTAGANTTNVQEGWSGATNEVKAIGVNFIIKAM